MKMTIEELKTILDNHKQWLNDYSTGSYANLSNVDLRNADLRNADLRYADLRYADLHNANLSDVNLRNADLRKANLSNVDLRNADLRYADLRYANLSDVNLRNADLRKANLSNVDLSNADLRYADLHNTNLSGANLSGITFDESTIGISNLCPTGQFIGWKKCRNETLVKLLIPARAKRSNATTYKCRCSEAKVLKIYDEHGQEIQQTLSCYDDNFVYEVGKVVKPLNDFDNDRWNECSFGIHFFIDKEMARQYEV